MNYDFLVVLVRDQAEAGRDRKAKVELGYCEVWFKAGYGWIIVSIQFDCLCAPYLVVCIGFWPFLLWLMFW